MKTKEEIIIYHSESSLELEVRLENNTVWLTQAQMIELFQRDQSVIARHIGNIFKEKELNEKSNMHFLHIANSDKPVKVYNLDVIISVGYRIKSQRGTLFRQWATQVLREHLLNGNSNNQRFERIESKLIEHDKKFDFFIKTSLPPIEGIFFDGQLFDAYKFTADLIKSAKKSIILIDNYVDENVLMLLTKREIGVTACIYTAQISKQLRFDLQHHNTQYPPITIKQFKQSHDRFLLIDDKDIYHIGASLKDLGKKWFAFSKLNLDINDIMQRII